MQVYVKPGLTLWQLMWDPIFITIAITEAISNLADKDINLF